MPENAKNCTLVSIFMVFSIFADEELVSCLSELAVAGSVALGHVLCYILMYVSMHPEVQEKMHEELDTVITDDRLPSLRDKSRLSLANANYYLKIESFVNA